MVKSQSLCSLQPHHEVQEVHVLIIMIIINNLAEIRLVLWLLNTMIKLSWFGRKFNIITGLTFATC